MNISWTPPKPRPGPAGAWDKFIGPGATPAENWLILGTALLAALALPSYAIWKGLGWSTTQLILAALIAFDLTGGVVGNAASPAKRWYHRPSQGFGVHIGFIAVHAMQPFLVAWLFRGMDWIYFAVFYSYLLVAALVILRTPLYFQRPLALALYLGAVLIDLYGFAPTPGLEWFVPTFFLKLLVSHLIKEAPFRPVHEISEVSETLEV